MKNKLTFFIILLIALFTVIWLIFFTNVFHPKIILNYPYNLQTDNSQTNSESKLVKLFNKISVEPIDGVLAESILIKVDPDKSVFYNIDPDGTYFIYLYTTISTNKTCNFKTDPETGCCFTLTNISLKTKSRATPKLNTPGKTGYIEPFPVGSSEAFKEIPINYCFDGESELTGGIGFLFPNGSIIIGSSTDLIFQHRNNGILSPLMEITIH